MLDARALFMSIQFNKRPSLRHHLTHSEHLVHLSTKWTRM